jgi:hypothetical protein
VTAQLSETSQSRNVIISFDSRPEEDDLAVSMIVKCVVGSVYSVRRSMWPRTLNCPEFDDLTMTRHRRVAGSGNGVDGSL